MLDAALTIERLTTELLLEEDGVREMEILDKIAFTSKQRLGLQQVLMKIVGGAIEAGADTSSVVSELECNLSTLELLRSAVDNRFVSTDANSPIAKKAEEVFAGKQEVLMAVGAIKKILDGAKQKTEPPEPQVDEIRMIKGPREKQ
jgi:hypothetical protein